MCPGSPDDLHIRWFEDGTLNVAANCIDRHLAKRGNQTAIIWGRRRSQGQQADQLPPIARRGLPLCQCAEGPGRFRKATGSRSICR